MALTLDDVQRIAYLARIEVTQHEAQQALSQLNGIFGLIGEMQAVNTDGIEPMAQAQDAMLRLREDVVAEADQHALFQTIAPQVETGLYLVPKVIE